jgi:hypothetical protein
VWNAVPTAVQARTDAQDTPNRLLLAAPLGLAAGWIRQFLPFHLSARVNEGLERLAVSEPTAVQARPEVHDTAESPLISAPAGFGVGSIFHAPLAALPAWLAWAAPAVTIPVTPASTVTTPTSQTACAQRTPARIPLRSRLTWRAW